MGGRFFRADVVRQRDVATPIGRVRVPRIDVRVKFLTGNGRFKPVECQWDTGADFSVLGESLARELGFDLARDPDMVLRSVTGVGTPVWFAPRWVRFAGLDGFQFRFRFLVIPGSRDPRPLLGLLDTAANFDVTTSGDRYYFFLADRHTGEAVRPDDDRAA